tara:strand:+ start:2994 stop:4517 length:1524 start_codon:yes stop_codon:yes gene_type:complete
MDKQDINNKNQICIEHIKNKTNELCNNHKNEPLFLSQFNDYIELIEDKIKEKLVIKKSREERKRILNDKKEAFINHFMETHNYYYIPESEIFIEYNKENYSQINENKIWVEIYNEVNKNKELSPWKQKVRLEIISQLKKHTIYNEQLIPETKTIQTVLQIMQSILLPNKHYSKYFLTLLGDCLLKKNISPNVIITTNNIDVFIDDLEFQIHHYMRCYFKDIFKHKYYNHNYDNIRLIQTRDCVDNAFIWSTTIKQYIFDIIFVACHYSKRYKNADNYIHNCCNHSDTKEKVLYCFNYTKEDILKSFIETMFEKNNKLCVFKTDLKYLINDYFEKIDIPKVLFYADVDEYFEKNFEELLDANNNTYFNGLTAKNSNFISSFNSLFSELFIINKDTKTYFEIDEILLIFSKKQKKQKYKKYELDEKMLLSLIKHYYPEVNITNNKYLNNIECNIWDKNQDISLFLDNDNSKNNENNTLHTEKLYEKYFKWCETNKKTFIVSKSYFEENI